MFKIKILLEHGDSIASRWTGVTDLGQHVFIKYMWGILRIEIDGCMVYRHTTDRDQFNGVIAFTEMLTLLKEDNENTTWLLDFSNFTWAASEEQIHAQLAVK